MVLANRATELVIESKVTHGFKDSAMFNLLLVTVTAWFLMFLLQISPGSRQRKCSGWWTAWLILAVSTWWQLSFSHCEEFSSSFVDKIIQILLGSRVVSEQDKYNISSARVSSTVAFWGDSGYLSCNLCVGPMFLLIMKGPSCGPLGPLLVAVFWAPFGRAGGWFYLKEKVLDIHSKK